MHELSMIEAEQVAGGNYAGAIAAILAEAIRAVGDNWDAIMDWHDTHYGDVDWDAYYSALQP